MSQDNWPSKDGSGCCRAKGNDQPGLDQAAFVIQPPATGLHLTYAWGFMQASFAARLMFEMFDGISDPSLGPVDPGFGQGGVENLASWANEGLSGQIFLVSGLLTDDHQLSSCRPLTAHHLGRITP